MFLGTLAFVCPAIQYGWLYTRLFERQKFLALRQSGDNYDCGMILPPSLKPDLDWWLQKVPHARNKMKIDSYIIEIYSDGWGAFWSELEQRDLINVLELRDV